MQPEHDLHTYTAQLLHQSSNTPSPPIIPLYEDSSTRSERTQVLVLRGLAHPFGCLYTKTDTACRVPTVDVQQKTKKAPPLSSGKALYLLQFRIIRHLLRSLQQSLLREPQPQELLLPSCRSGVCAWPSWQSLPCSRRSLLTR